MKKIISFLLLIIMVFCIASCTVSMPQNNEGSNAPVSGDTENQDDDSNSPTDNKITDETDNAIQQEEENKLQFETKNLGETISLPFVEMTLDKITSAEKLYPTDTSGVYSYMTDQEGEKYFYLFGTIKNIGTDSYSVEDIVAEIIIDDKYKYSAYIKADDGGNDFYGDYVKPFGSVKYYLYASIPDELMAQYKKASISFGFCEDFGGSYYDDFDECDYLYSITASK